MNATVFRAFCGVMAVSLVVSVPALGQQPPEAAMRANTTISAIDRQAIQRWVESLLDGLLAATDAETPDPQFLSGILGQYNAQGATAAFKDAVAKSVIEGFRKRYAGQTSAGGESGPHPLAVVRGFLALNAFADPSSYDVYMKGLGDKTASGVRLLAAEGLIAIRPKLNAQQWAAVLKAVQAAGESETDPAALARYYRLLSNETGAAAQPACDVMLRIVDSRLNRFEQKGELPAAADRLAAEWLGARAAATTNTATQNAILLRIARLLADAAHSYVTTDVPLRREPLERVILAAEQQLKTVAGPKAAGKPVPDVTKAMQDAGPDQAAKMQAEVDKWIGTANAPGLLNAAPFGMPVGLGIKRPTPPTTAPTS